MQKIAESETKMQKAAEMLQQRSLSRNKSSDTDLQERLRRSKEIGESIVQEKVGVLSNCLGFWVVIQIICALFISSIPPAVVEGTG